MRKKSDAPVGKDGVRKPHKFRRLVLLALLVLIPSLVWAALPFKDRLAQKRQISEYEEKLKAVKADNARVKKEISGLRDDDYIEMKARQDLGLVRPGEELYIINGLEATQTTESARKKPAKKAKPAPSLWEQALLFLGLK